MTNLSWKKTWKALFIGAAAAVVIMAFNAKVGTKQGIDFKVTEKKIPLYLKTLDFIDRHYNYSNLVSGITKPGGTVDEKVMDIFKWTFVNIRRQPTSLPTVDDHPWHIIVRGYGAGEQYSDVFTTLCTYAGAPAYFILVKSRDGSRRYPFSVVRMNGRERVFDPYNGVYFVSGNGEQAGIEDVAAMRAQKICLSGEPDVDYGEYLPDLMSPKNTVIRRASAQDPLGRMKAAIAGAVKMSGLWGGKKK
ncbi:MAG: hypothetical protein HQL30_06910 [Candidatus Omnitrophica bacterium]|nr:hypothetical protein [Candidatus Omnitrophota bacterium]